MKIRMLAWCCLWVCLGVGCVSRGPSIVSDEPSAPVEMELLLVGTPTLKQLKNHAVVSFTVRCRPSVELLFPEDDYCSASFLHKKEGRFVETVEPGTLEAITSRNSWKLVPVFARGVHETLFEFEIDSFSVLSFEEMEGLIIGIPVIPFEKLKTITSVNKIHNDEHVVYFELIKGGQFVTKLTPLTWERCSKESAYYADFPYVFEDLNCAAGF